MMIDPPIDKLIELSDCKYALVVVTAKRVRELLDKKKNQVEASGIKPVTYAAKEIYEGKVAIGKD